MEFGINTPFSLPDNEAAEPGSVGMGEEQQQKMCQKSGKPCIDATTQPGKRQRQLNERILEVQSQIELMLSSAELQNSAGDKPPSSEDTLHSPSELSRNTQPDRNLFINGNPGMEDLESSIQSWLADHITDLDDRTAETIFGRYLTNMAPKLPVVVFAPGTTAADVRSGNPLLFLAILDVASSGFLYDRIAPATWYRTIEPVEPGEQMDIYQISHTAANMALIMRLGETLNAKSGGSVHAESLEARRVWLGCHYICSNTSMSLRAPNVMRWTRLMDECLEVLETSPAALPSDKVLCRHIRLQHITEEFAMQVSVEEASSHDKAQAIRVQMTHRAFKRQLNEWGKDVADGCWDEALEFSYYFSRLYINEVAYCTPTTDDVTVGSPSIVSIETHAIPEFMETTDNIFRVFASLDMSTIRALPAMYLIRIIYTFMILVKLYFAATKLPIDDARLPVARLQVSHRLNRVIQMSAGWGPLWPATKLTTVFSRMRSWSDSGDGNPQRLQQAGSSLTLWEFRTPSLNGDAHGMEMVESDFGVDTPPFSLEQPLGTDFSIVPPFRPMSPTTESCFPRKEATGFMQDDAPLDACDTPNIEQMDESAYMGLDWSQVPDMGFDLCNLDAPFSPIPVPNPGFDPNALMKENSQIERKDGD
ncbi:hypothetical protein CNMCM7691_001283 [Aspergillus felis]|uniref:C6 transcription factor n=1 Tax=Aspergillus felis TaxID=1287682 RepID=A0A8H6VCI9_9EURO|nr:hypothetical protein CNMCM7691_001283 [Aspergillus felis]